MQHVDLNLLVHGGFAHLAYAVGAKKVIQIHMVDDGGGKLLHFEDPESYNFYFPSYSEVDYPALKKKVKEYLV